MTHWKKTLTLVTAALVCMPAFAQQAEEQQALEEREARDLERETEILAEEALEIARQRGGDTEEAEVRLREAEARMTEAAQRVAELSMRQLPRVERIERIIRTNRGPVLGVTIGGANEDGPVEGIEILGVTPGGAAEEAGLRAGDIITSINSESFTADNNEEAMKKLLDFMEGVEEGDELDVGYLRNGKSASVEVQPMPIANVFAFDFNRDDFIGPDFDVHVAPGARGPGNPFIWFGHDDGFGDMELVKLTERLGSYFGTDEGLLVVRAPGKEELELEDGDVILSIDGRTPNSVSHAMRILGSYQAGEELKIEIMRDRRKRTIEIEMPDNRQSRLAPPRAPRASTAPRPAAAPRPPVAPAGERT